MTEAFPAVRGSADAGAPEPVPPSSGVESERLRYRVLTGPDDAAFCRRVSDVLDEGYVLHGSPSITNRHGEVLVAQAVVLPPDV